VSGVPVGGLGRDAAVSKLDDAALAAQGPIPVRAGGRAAALDLSAAGLELDAPATVDGPSTEVELRFTPAGAQATRIDLEHRGWELLGAEAFKREGYAEGWERLFSLFRDVADARRGDRS